MRVILTFFISLSFFFLSAQSLQVSPASLDFGDVWDDAPDSLQLTVSNPSNTETVEVQQVKLYDIYNHQDFVVSDTAFTLTPGSSNTLWVKFSPRHNITYTSQLVILDDGKRGGISVTLLGKGRYRNTYYNTTFDKAEEALKTAIKSRLAQGATQLSYNTARDYMFMNIDNQKVNGRGAAQNTLECVYTGRTVVGYTNRQDAQFNFSNKFNTEHTYPQSLFSSSLPMQSDLHHLFPSWENANSQRSNYPFGLVLGSPDWQDGGSKRKGSLFEPRPEHKGRVARAMMYFVVRYQNYSNFLSGQEAVLRGWHQAYAPDSIDRRRNDDVFSYQNNRNPFVDYPQFLERISSLSTTSVASDQYSLDITETGIDFGMVDPGTPQVYSYVLVNYGNQPIDLTQVGVSHPDLDLINGSQADHTLQPGEGHIIYIQLDPLPGRQVADTLKMNSTLPGQPQIEIPISATVSGTNAIDLDRRDPAAPLLAPNPTRDRIGLQWPSAPREEVEFTLLDLQGRRVQSGSLSRGADLNEIAIPGLGQGLYLLNLSWGSHQQGYKVEVLGE